MIKEPVILSAKDPSHQFAGTPGSVINIATSGDLAGATLKLRYRVRNTDEWVVDPNNVFNPDTHWTGQIEINARYNQIILENPDPATNVAIQF